MRPFASATGIRLLYPAEYSGVAENHDVNRVKSLPVGISLWGEHALSPPISIC
jgi:hypothetical protein